MGTTRIAPRRYIDRRRARRVPLVLGTVGALAIALAMALWFGTAAAVGRTEQPTSSTPRSDWRAGEAPFLYQTDPQWASHPYAGGTVENQGALVQPVEKFLSGHAVSSLFFYVSPRRGKQRGLQAEIRFCACGQ